MTVIEEITEHFPEIKKYAIQLTKAEDRGEDLAQDTMVRALRYADRYEEQGYMRAWLYRITRNLFLTSAQREARWAEYDKDQIRDVIRPNIPQAAGADLDARQQAKRIKDHLEAHMNPDFYRVLLLVSEGHSYAEVAEIMDSPIGTVTSRIMRARLQARALLEEIGIQREITNSKAQRSRGTFTATSPDGVEYRSDNTAQFAKDHGLSRKRISDCLSGEQSHHHGWTFKEITK